jgi:hypothetical protein
MAPRTNTVANLSLLVSHFGSMATLSKACEMPYSQTADLVKGRMQLDDRQAREMEAGLGLPPGWLTTAHNPSEPLPDSLMSAQEVTRSNSDETQSRRKQNLERIVGDVHGAKIAFTRKMQWYPSEWNRTMKQGFGFRRAAIIEDMLGLKRGWLDLDHTEAEYEAARAWNREHVAAPNIGADRPLAKALLLKIQRLVEHNRLPEKKAHQLLGELLDLDES